MRLCDTLIKRKISYNWLKDYWFNYSLYFLSSFIILDKENLMAIAHDIKYYFVTQLRNKNGKK